MRLLVSLLLLALPATAAARQAGPDPFGRAHPPRVYTTVRLQGPPPDIDGSLDDAAWQQGEWSGHYTQNMPTEGGAPSEKTEIKVLYDDRHVYVAIHAYDDPALIHRYPGRRDSIVGDIAGICFDSYFDKREGFEFDLNAAGVKTDLVLTNEGWDVSWDAVWYGKVGIQADGWVAEFKIPLSQLRYGTQDVQTWGMHAWRWIDRNQEEDQWNLIPRNNTGRMHNIGELHGIRDLPHYRHVELLPHTLAKIDAQPVEAGNPYRNGATAGGALGLDAKVGLTTDFTLDATINPDFGQVEADPSVVNLTAYETFFEEKRPFFVEGKGILTLNLDGELAPGDVPVDAGTNEMLFYSRRIGQAPAYAPPLEPGAFADVPDSTSILSAAKVTGKTRSGLSLGLLQSVTGAEHARVSFDGVEREPAVQPSTNFLVGRVQKDWDGGGTILGGMLTSTHRWISDDALRFLPSDAVTGAVDFARFFANRSYVFEAKGAFSRITGDADAIRALQRNPVHYFQRPDASHLTVDGSATSMAGHAGTLRFARYGNSKWTWGDSFRWASPGFELNDVGFLRQADFVRNVAKVAYRQTDPRGPFRTYSVVVQREDAFDTGGLKTDGLTILEASGALTNKWQLAGILNVLEDPVDTRLLRGGPAMRLSGSRGVALSMTTDPSRRVVFGAGGSRSFGAEAGSHQGDANVSLQWRPMNRLNLQALVDLGRNVNDLQYVSSEETSAGPRYLLGRVDQDTLATTFRADLQLTPDLSVQYYGSPFVSNGRFTSFKRAADTHADAYAGRFHAFGSAEIGYDADRNAYDVVEPGVAYSFSNPDFSVREFRSNLVTRWEFTPGSTLFVVWSQGRTSADDRWDSSIGHGLDRLWATPAENVLLVKISYWFSM